MLILDKKIPRHGLTFDNTPKVRIRLTRPLPPDHVVMVVRNGVDAGPATLVTGNDYEFTDVAQLGGPVDYKAEVRNVGGGAPQVSNTWPIIVVQLTQAWSTTVGNDQGPFIAGATGSKEWDGNYNDSFYIGVVGTLPPDAQVTWETQWTPGYDGWSPPTTTPLPPVYDLPWRLQVQAQSSGMNYSSGVLDITMLINGVPMGDKLTLVLNDIPYGYEGATWAVWSAPTGKYELSFTNVYGTPTPQTEIRQKVTNNTEATKQFDLFGLSNDALDGEQSYFLNVQSSVFSPNSMLTLDVELYRKVGADFVLDSTLSVNDENFAQDLSNFLLDGFESAADRFARFSLLPEGYVELVSNVDGDYWAGNLNGVWSGKVNTDLTDSEQISNNIGSELAIYRSFSTSETHDNPLSENYGGVWSWRDDSGALMTFDTDKFVTGLSGSNWSNAGPQFIMALDGMTNSGRLRLRWTANQAGFFTFTGEAFDYAGSPGSMVNVIKSDGAIGTTVLAAQKSDIHYVTQLLAGQFVEFEFYATTEDRNISKLVPMIQLSNSGI